MPKRDGCLFWAYYKLTMVIIKFLAKNIKLYLKNYQQVSPKMTDPCPDCDRKLYKHGKYERSVVTRKGESWIPIYRWFCPACGKTFSLLPDFLLPYHVYSGLILERVWVWRFIQKKSYRFVINKIRGISLQTIKRWTRVWKSKCGDLIDQLYFYIIDVEPSSIQYHDIKSLSLEENFVFLLQRLWKILHHVAAYPFYGFFPWINKLVHKS